MGSQTRSLLHVFPTFAVGGAQMRFVRLANHFGSRYRHHIIAMDGITGAFDRLDPALDAKVIAVKNRRGKTLENLLLFRETLGDLRPDLLVTSNWGTIEWVAASFGCRIPHLHMEDGFGSDESQRQLQRRIWARRILLRSSKLIVPSVTLYSIARDIWRIPNRRILQIPNGVDCDRFSEKLDDDVVGAFGITRERPVVGAVAPLRREKNLSRLIDAFAQVIARRPAQLVIVGDGPERGKLEAQADQQGIARHVVFTGFCATPEKVLPAFSVFAVSSDTEQMPLSVLEAMASGRSVVATNVGDIQYMLARENHPFVVQKSVGKLAEAMLGLINDPARAAIIGAANAQRAREIFDQTRMFAAYGQLFDECGGGRGNSAMIDRTLTGLKSKISG